MKWSHRRAHSFTLVELLAVVVVLLTLAVITIGIASYVKKRMATSSAKSQIAMISTALELYKADVGYYPRTGVIRISQSPFFFAESTNNNTLYRALSGTCANCNKVYLRFSANQIHTNQFTHLPNIMDPYGNPYNYYCSPTTSLIVSNGNCPGCGFTVGGQVTPLGYDLFSYGLDNYTYVPGSIVSTNIIWNVAYTNTSSAIDDITNWKP